MTAQKDRFLTSEGDAWFRRNADALEARDWSADVVCARIEQVSGGRSLRILEIGCGEGSRLRWLADRGHVVTGVEPSGAAVARCVERGVPAHQATADALPFPEASFDLVIFGFCLYLCDDEDLFAIAAQADRVLANPGWMLILDFESAAPRYRPYHHLAGVMSRKMDNKAMFLWHPSYTLAGHEKFHHSTLQWTDDPEEWVGLACLRKFRST